MGKSTAGKITAASLAAERQKKSKLTSEQFTVGSKDWQLCPICTGYFASSKWNLKVGAKKVPICAWCFSRGGKFLILFIQFVEAYAVRSCEADDMDRVSNPCKCGPCVAGRLLAYREQVVGTQVSPIKG
jgi:hypothetical protein